MNVVVLSTAVNLIKNKLLKEAALDCFKNYEHKSKEEIAHTLGMINSFIEKKHMEKVFIAEMKILLPDLEVKKPVAKKVVEKVVESTQKSKKSLELASSFPDTYETPYGTGIALQETKTLGKLRELNKDNRVVCALYWSKRLCRQYAYDKNGLIGQPKEFVDEFDLVTTTFIGDKVFHTVSLITEMITMMGPDSLEFTEEGMNFRGGIEFVIYLVDKSKMVTKEETKARLEILRDVAYPQKKVKEAEVVTTFVEKEAKPEAKVLPVEDARKPSKEEFVEEVQRLQAKKKKAKAKKK